MNFSYNKVVKVIEKIIEFSDLFYKKKFDTKQEN